MDLNRGRRRIPLSEEPRRPPWKLIVFLLSAVALLAALWSSLGIEIKVREVPRLPTEEEPLLPVASSDLPPGVADEEAIEPALRPAVVTTRWARPPAPYYPRGAEKAPNGEGRVMLSCFVKADRRMGPCRIISETPQGYGFGRSALAAAGGARVADEIPTGVQVQFSIRYLPPRD